MLITAAKVKQAAEVLEVEVATLTSKSLASAYRSKAKECHPDHHGSTQLALWSQVSWANEVLKRHLEAAPAVPEASESNASKCRACNGSGRVSIPRSTSFGRPLTMQCVMCRGTGEMFVEHDTGDGS